MTNTAEQVLEELNAPIVAPERKIPSSRALVLSEKILRWAIEVYKYQVDPKFDIAVSATATTTLDVDDLPTEFLQTLINNGARIKLSAKAQRIIRKKLGDYATSPIKTINQLRAAFELVNNDAQTAQKPALEAKLNGRWYPVTLRSYDIYNGMFSGPYMYASIQYKIGELNQTRSFYIDADDLQDDKDPLRNFTLNELLEKKEMRLCTQETLDAYKVSMEKLKEFNEKPGAVLLAKTSALGVNKFLWMNSLSPVVLGTEAAPKLVLVEPSLEVQAQNDRYWDRDDGQQVTLPYIRVFALTLKRYVYMDVNDVELKPWHEDAIDRLHLPEEMRTVLTQVFTAPEVFGDMFAGRHGGMVILANGGSGVGKTLTAEVFSEITKRPLYSLEMGELGTNLDQVEQSLQRIFARAARWNAVLLFDEADIFLSKRTENDLERSAIVGVFLRLLDQYEGMFFLTTNRAEVIDPAFASRITLRLDYPNIDHPMRMKIWRNMLGSAGITTSDEDLHLLADAKPLNGRQVRNQVRLIKIVYPTATTLTFEQLKVCLRFAA